MLAGLIPTTIGSLLRSLFAVMLALVIGASAAPIYTGLRQRAESRQVAETARAGRAVFTALQELRPERGPTIIMLLGKDPASKAFLTTNEGVRQKSGPALDAVLRQCAEIDCTGAERAIFDGLPASIGKVVSLRKEVDAAARVPLAERRPGTVKEFETALTDLIDRLEKMSDVLGTRARMADAETAELMAIKQAAWLARDKVGSERRVIGQAINAKSITPQAKMTSDELHAVAEATWSVVQDLAARPGAPAEIVAAVKTGTRESFETYEKVRRAAYDAVVAGRPSPVSSDELVHASNAALDALMAVPTVAMELAERHAEQTYAAVERALALNLALFAVALAAGAAGFVLVQRRVTRPIAQITSAMSRLAQGDMETAIPGSSRADEIGAMAKALLTFKDATLDRQRMEREVAADRERAEAEHKREEAAAIVRERSFVGQAIGGAMAELARGDLTFRLTAEMPEVYEQLRADFNTAMDQLQETMRVISGTTDGMRSGTGEISHAADDLSRRTEQQAASLEETAAALDEITATVRKTAEGALLARAAVATAKQEAERSGEIVGSAVSAMGEIERSSAQISQIIGVIDEIAFQTNLLALNAGVEAARAGEAGRGFAVVAQEVRALAQRSAEAAKEIKGLIQASARQVSSGVELVGETGRALGRIATQVEQIISVVSEIAASAQEQSTGLAEVNTAVNQMDQVTQQNAAMVEESTAASHTLAQEAEQLASLVGRFQIDTAAIAAPRARGTTRAASPRAGRAAIPAVHGNTALKLAPADAAWEEF